MNHKEAYHALCEGKFVHVEDVPCIFWKMDFPFPNKVRMFLRSSAINKCIEVPCKDLPKVAVFKAKWGELE